MGAGLVPAVDPAGLPGPPWLFHALLVFTFFLHLLFMNLVLGGTVVAGVSHLRARGRAADPSGVLARRLMAMNRFGISMAITTGVAPLLFVQVLYQPYFYSGTILMGWFWFALLIFLTVGYYAAYAYKFRAVRDGRTGGGAWLAIAAVSFVLISLIHVAVHLIHVQPAGWAGFAAAPSAVLVDPTFWPRWLHFVLTSLGFAALVATWWAAREAAQGIDVEVNVAIARAGWRWAVWTTALVIADGFLLLAVLPREVLLGMMRGGLATLGPLSVSILLGIGLIAMMARAIDPVANRSLVTGTLAAMLLTVAVMSITRHQVRVLYLAPFTGATAWRVVPQWGNFLLFVVCLVAALAAVAWMTRSALAEIGPLTSRTDSRPISSPDRT